MSVVQEVVLLERLCVHELSSAVCGVFTSQQCCAVYMGQAARDLGEVVCYAWWRSQGANCHFPKAVLPAFPGSNLIILCVCAVIRTSLAMLGPRCSHVTLSLGHLLSCFVKFRTPVILSFWSTYDLFHNSVCCWCFCIFFSIERIIAEH